MTQKAQVQRKLFTVEQMAEYLEVGRSKAYQLTNQSDFYPALRIGRSVRISIEALDRWIAEQTKGA